MSSIARPCKLHRIAHVRVSMVAAAIFPGPAPGVDMYIYIYWSQSRVGDTNWLSRRPGSTVQRSCRDWSREARVIRATSRDIVRFSDIASSRQPVRRGRRLPCVRKLQHRASQKLVASLVAAKFFPSDSSHICVRSDGMAISAFEPHWPSVVFWHTTPRPLPNSIQWHV